MNLNYFQILVLRFIKIWLEFNAYGLKDAQQLWREVDAAIRPNIELEIEEEK